MSFAALEARADAAVLARLSNARGSFGGPDFPVVFDHAYVETNVGVGALKPTARMSTALLADCTPNDTHIWIDDVEHIVRDVQPDNGTLSLLVLEAV